MYPIVPKIPQSLHVKFLAALAVVGLFATLVAVGVTTGTTQAQSATNDYANPQPCGPHAATANQPPPHEITQGHFALFDSYWWNDQTTEGQGVIYVNRCPPKMVTTRAEGEETIARAASGIDIDEGIIHVTDDFSVDVVATNAEVTAKGELSLEEYPDVRDALGLRGPDNTLLPVPEGTKVWWLRLDDPDTTRVEESDMTIGFSTELFESKYWLTSSAADGDKPMRYMFESKRYPSIESPDDESTGPKKVPHFLTYEAPTAGTAKPVRIWDSTAAHTNAMEMEPGEYRQVQWIFTQPGTYFMESHLVGHVRDKTKKLPTSGADWKPISSDKTEAAETVTYVFQVKDLSEMEPPMFGVYHDIKENTPPGTKLGDPIRVFESKAETLQYSLTGTGSSDFALMPTTNPHAVQLAVASGVNLDFERQRSYDLTLGVTDLVDHESNPNSTIDDSLKIEVDLEDIPLGVTLSASNTNPRVGETITITAETHDLGAYNAEWVQYTFDFSDRELSPQQSSNIRHMVRMEPKTVTVTVEVIFRSKGNPNSGADDVILTGTLDVTWSNPS